jgi:hypothetical protein
VSAGLRARFEAWAKSKSLCLDTDFGPWGDPMYKHPKIDAMWYSWQGCAETLKPIQSLQSTGDDARDAARWRFIAKGILDPETVGLQLDAAITGAQGHE